VLTEGITKSKTGESQMASLNVAVEMTITARAHTDVVDNGMGGPHYRAWTELDLSSVEVDTVEMFGTTWTLKSLSEKLGEAGAKAFWAMLKDEAKEHDWNMED
jgi:hypothetical protein